MDNVETRSVSLCPCYRDIFYYILCATHFILRSAFDLPREFFQQHAPRHCELQDGWIILTDLAISIDYKHLQLAMKHCRNVANFGPTSGFTDTGMLKFSVSTSHCALFVVFELLPQTFYEILSIPGSTFVVICSLSVIATVLACKLSHLNKETCLGCSDSMLSHC